MKLAFEQYLYEQNRDGSGKASSYMMALHWLGQMLRSHPYNFTDCLNIWSVDSAKRIIQLRAFVLDEQKKGNDSRWVHEDIPISYLRDGYCSAALTQLIEFLPAHQHTQKVLQRFEDHHGPESDAAAKLDLEPELPENFVHDPNSKDGQDRIREAKVRIGQRAFRQIILKVYHNRCCLTDLDIPTVNRASHIIGWADNKKTRMDPRNGICLSATYDAAFDKHLISLDEDYRLILSKDLQEFSTKESFQKHFASFRGKRIALPRSYLPKLEYLKVHRKAGCF